MNLLNILLTDSFIFAINFWMRMWNGNSWMKSFVS